VEQLAVLSYRIYICIVPMLHWCNDWTLAHIEQVLVGVMDTPQPTSGKERQPTHTLKGTVSPDSINLKMVLFNTPRLGHVTLD
jgi:hypothetical protein